MSSSSPTERRRAVVEAGHRGDLAIVDEALNDPHPGVRASAVHARGRRAHLPTQIARRAAADAHPAVRRAAATLGATHPEIDLALLLNDADATVVEVAAWACGERVAVPGDTITSLCELGAGHADALVRESAVAALGAIGSAAGRATVLAAMGDKATVRRRAVLALAAFDGPDVEQALADASDDRDWQVRQGADDLRRVTQISPDPDRDPDRR